MSVGCSKVNATRVLKGFGEVGFGTKGVDGGIELAKLILIVMEARDVGGKPPVLQLVGGFSQMGVASSAPLQETKEPGAHRLRGE